MSRVAEVNRRYAAAASVARHGVEILAVGHPEGARFNAVTRRLLNAAREDGPGLWDDLVGAAKAHRWRLVTQPQPLAFNTRLQEGADDVLRQARRLRGAVTDDSLLNELCEAARGTLGGDAPLGGVLLRCIHEVGADNCAVVAMSASARAGLQAWLGEQVAVLTATELDRALPDLEQCYAVGPARFFRSSLITAPATPSVSFLMPAWFADRSTPKSVLASYADGAIRVDARIFTEGDLHQPDGVKAPDVEEEVEDFLPEPVWGRRRSEDREPAPDEVEARKLLLSGGLALWLDDGDRIRALDPKQPPGERVIYADVPAVRVGTYLLLRTGETERRALHRAALGILSNRADSIQATQHEWKSRLQERLLTRGRAAVVRALRAQGVKTAERVRAWCDPNLVRPHSDNDFELLLNWLGLPVQPSFGYATVLRRALYQASADVREQLEDAVSAVDLSVLERDGHLTLDIADAGFRGILATRVLALAPFTEVVPRHDARVPFPEGAGRWLE